MPSVNRDFANYDAVIAEIKRIAEQGAAQEFRASTLANVRDLIEVCRNRVPLPNFVGRGYYPTFILQWGFVQVEVFEEHLEVYHLKDGQTSIWYEEHNPGSIFSHRFIAELAALNE